MNASAPTRRDFLATLALAGAAAPLAGTALAAEKKKKDAPAAPAVPAGKLGALHVFTKPMHEMSHAATAKLVAECGFTGLDYTVRKAQAHVLPEKVESDLPRAIDAARAAGLAVEMITTDIMSAREPHTETILRTAAKHGVKFYRLGNYTYDAKLGILGTLEKLQPQLKELGDLNATLGLHGAIQNHTGVRVGSPVWDLYYLLKDLDPRWIGVQYDIRHGTTEGGASWPLALKMIAPWVRCSDVKDFRWEQSPGKATVEAMPLGAGIVPLDAYYKLFRELGLGGPISIHLEYPPFEHGPKFASAAEQRAAFATALKKDAAVLKAVLAKNGLA